jgi:hypothetical protein
MRSKEKMYGFPEYLWSPSSFEWGGLYSHNLLMEGIRDNNDYTPEQLVRIAADTREKDRLYQYHCQKALRANNHCRVSGKKQPE